MIQMYTVATIEVRTYMGTYQVSKTMGPYYVIIKLIIMAVSSLASVVSFVFITVAFSMEMIEHLKAYVYVTSIYVTFLQP